MKILSAMIDGTAREAGQDTFKSVNPANFEDIVGVYGNASVDECRDACKAAKRAFQMWRETPAPVRAEAIQNFGVLLKKNKEALSQLVSREMGKPIREARGDVQEAIDTCNFFVSEGRRLYGQTVPSEMPNKELFTYRRPIGVFACITAGNFPVAVPSWYFVPALIAGNTCVWKPSEDTPKTSQVFAELLEAAGVPKGVFNVVFGAGPKTGAALIQLVEEGLIDKVGFTGSSTVGKLIGEICGRNFQTPCLELGGKNPLVVAPDANLDLAAHGIVWSGFGTAGQRCTSLGNLIVHKSVKEPLIEKVLKKVSSLKIGNPLSEEIFLGPLISEKFLKNHLAHLESLVKSHHKLITPKQGRIASNADYAHFIGSPEKGYFAFPTIVDNVSAKDEIYRTETFGPLFNVLTYEDLDEAIELANGTGFGLSSAIYSDNVNTIYKYKTQISAGMTSINNGTTGAEAHLPFGGNGKSGNGSRQSGIWVIDQFTKWQAVNWDVSGKLQLAQIDTVEIHAKDYTVTP